MLCHHVMSAWVVYGFATWPCPKLDVRRYVFTPHAVWVLGPLLIPFDSGLSTHSKPPGHDFANQKDGPQCTVLFPKVLCCHMEHGAQMSMTLRCLRQHETKGSFTAFRAISTEDGRQQQTTASNLPAVRQKRLVTAW